MDLGFLASANSITTKYLSQNVSPQQNADTLKIDEDTKKSFGAEFEKAYDSMVSTKILSTNLRQSYEAAHQDSYKEHASRLSFSIDNRVIDMLQLQLSDEMSSRVNIAMENATQSLTESIAAAG
jgi:hypothetical protein